MLNIPPWPSAEQLKHPASVAKWAPPPHHMLQFCKDQVAQMLAPWKDFIALEPERGMKTRLPWTNRFCIWRYDPQSRRFAKPIKSARCKTSNARYYQIMTGALHTAHRLNWADITKPFEIILSNGDDEPMLPKLPSLAAHRLPMVRGSSALLPCLGAADFCALCRVRAHTCTTREAGLPPSPGCGLSEGT